MTTFDVSFCRTGRTMIDWPRRMLLMRKPADAIADINRPMLTYAHYKRDGMRVTICGGACITTRGHDIADRLRLPEVCADPRVLIDAELYVPDQGREAVKTALADDPDALQISVFACNQVDQLRDLTAWCVQHGLNYEPVIDICKQRIYNNRTHDGFVLKSQRMYGYWLKEKARMTADLIVTGVRPGKGQHSGRIGALELADASGRPVCAAGAMDVPMRIALTEMHRSGQLVGRVVEIAYERVGSRGGLQHPRFVSLRDDKEVRDADIIPSQG